MGDDSPLMACLYDSNATGIGGALIDASYALDIVYGTYACTPWKWEYLVSCGLVLLLLVGFRWLFDLSMRFWTGSGFTLADALTTKDNHALAIDYASFLFSMCLITRGSLTDLAPNGAASPDTTIGNDNTASGSRRQAPAARTLSMASPAAPSATVTVSLA